MIRLPRLPLGNATSILDALSSRLGTALLAGAVAFFLGFQSGGHDSDLAQAKARAEAAQRDLKTSQASEVLTRMQAGSLAAQLKANQERLRALQASVPRGPAGPCALDERAARRLRDIR